MFLFMAQAYQVYVLCRCCQMRTWHYYSRGGCGQVRVDVISQSLKDGDEVLKSILSESTLKGNHLTYCV